jgi:phosphoserine aminotransferase
MLGSMYNTPPCWAIYMCGLVFDHMLRNGGLAAQQVGCQAPPPPSPRAHFRL